jgi:hypothetical protein
MGSFFCIGGLKGGGSVDGGGGRLSDSLDAGETGMAFLGVTGGPERVEFVD